jgi:hypothetical protein
MRACLTLFPTPKDKSIRDLPNNNKENKMETENMEMEDFGYCEDCYTDYADEEQYCETCAEMEAHDCDAEGCYGDNPNAHIEAFGTYAPGSDFDDYYNQ